MTLQQYVASWHARVMTQIMNKAYKVTHERLSLSLFTLCGPPTLVLPPALLPLPSVLTPDSAPLLFLQNSTQISLCLGPVYLMCQTKPGSLSEVPLTSHTSLSQCLLPLQLYSWLLFKGPWLPCPLFYPPASITMPSTKQWR